MAAASLKNGRVDKKLQKHLKKVKYSQPFVHFCIQQMPNGAWDAHAQLDVEKVKYGSVQIRGLNGKIDYQSQSQTNDPLYRLSFKVDAADYKQDSFHLSAQAITGFSQSTTAALGTHLENLKVSLLSPQVTINQLAKFNVPTVELQLTKSGLVNIKVSAF